MIIKKISFSRWAAYDILFSVFLILSVMVSVYYQAVTEQISLQDIDIPWMHDVNLDPETQTFRVTGAEPGIGIRIQGAEYPIRGLKLEISGFHKTEDNDFIVYYIPYDKADNSFDINWQIIPDVHYSGQNKILNVSFYEPAANKFRIDLPLEEDFTLESITVKYQKPIPAWIKMLWAFLAIYTVTRGLYVLICRFIRAKYSYKTTAVVFALLILFFLKLWLVQGLPLWARGDHNYDDLLFLEMARNILQGEWLGPYHVRTLIKGPGYPLWIAFTFIAGIPLLLAQHLFYISACAVLLFFFRSLISRPLIFCAMAFPLLLFNPGTYSTEILRVIRDGIYPALTIWTFAFLIGLFAERKNPIKYMLICAAGAGISFSAFWITREEGILLLPSVLLLMGYTAYRIWHSGTERKYLRACICFMPLFVWVIALFALSGCNYVNYGVFCTVEMKNKEFRKAYGALTRVIPPVFIDHVPVTKETRKEIYKVSPAFAELQTYLEGDLGKTWANSGERATGFTEKKDEIIGGWFLWAFRNAAAMKGHYITAGHARKYYKRLAEEVNEACEKGMLPCGTERATLTPPWRSEYLSVLLQALPGAMADVAGFAHIEVSQIPSEGSEESLLIFKELTGNRLAPIAGEKLNMPLQEKADHAKILILQQITSFYKYIMPFLTIAAVAFYFIRLFSLFFSKCISFLFILNSAIFMAIAARILILLYIDITSFPGMNSQYLASAYALLLVFCCVSTADFFHLLNDFRKNQKKGLPEPS